MREMKKEDAIREYGSRYSPTLEGLELNVHHHTSRTPEEALIEKLNRYSGERMDGTVKVVEELGHATESFHYKDIEDVKQRAEAETRAEYRKAMRAISVEIQTAGNNGLLEGIDDDIADIEPERKPLQEAFMKAYEKLVRIDEFLGSREPFTVAAEPMKDVITVPDVIASKGDTVYIVQDDGEKVPSITETTIIQRDFDPSFFRGPDYTVSYETPLDAGKKQYERMGLISVDPAGGGKIPEGAFAKGLNSTAFNDKAAAEKHIGTLLDARETELESQLKKLRETRKGLKP